MRFQVVVSREPLADLLGQVAVGHRVADHHRAQPPFFQNPADPAGGLGLAAAGPDRADGDDRLGRFDHGVGRGQEDEVGPGGRDQRGLVHHLDVGDVGVGKGGQVDFMIPDQIDQGVFGVNRDALGVKLTGQLGRVAPAVNVRDLGGGETDDPVAGVVSKVNVEVVKIPTGRPDDNYFFHTYRYLIAHDPSR